jgi:hypothetical protein
VIEPGERLDPVEFFAFECLACRVKRKPARTSLRPRAWKDDEERVAGGFNFLAFAEVA